MTTLGVIGAILAAVVTATGAWFVARTQAKADATGHIVTRMKDQDDRLDKQQDEIDEVRKELRVERERSDEQGRTLARHDRRLTAWQAWGRDLHDRWDYHRSKTIPPPLPDTD